MKLTTRVEEFCFTFKEICVKEKMTNAFSRADGDFHLDWKVITAISSKRRLSVPKHGLYCKAPLIERFQSRDLILIK